MGSGKRVSASGLPWLRGQSGVSAVVFANAGAHVGAWCLAFAAAASARSWPTSGPRALATAALVFVGVRTTAFALARGFAAPRSDGGRSAAAQSFALSLATTLLLLVGASALARLAPWRFVLLDGSLGCALVMAVRAAPTLRARWRSWRSAPVERLVLVGRPEQLYRALGSLPSLRRANPTARRRRLALLADGVIEPRGRLRGAPMIDATELDRRLVRGLVQRVIVVPPLSPSLRAWVERSCQSARVPCVRSDELDASLPALLEALARHPESLLDAPSSTQSPRSPPTMEEPHALDRDFASDPPGAIEHAIAETFEGKRVLVTGAAGTLGAAVARALCRFAPREIILVDRVEGALWRLAHELGRSGTASITPALLDARDGDAVLRLCADRRPEVILHAAAWRRPLTGERHPSETVLNNVLGARNFADAAERHGVARFLLVSSDAAAAASTHLGASFRVAELHLQALAAHAATRFVSLRLGPVLSPDGGFGRQVYEAMLRGAPLPLPHREQAPRFVPVCDVGLLVLGAIALGQSGDVLIDAQRPATRLEDLARRMVEGAGLSFDTDVVVEEVGLCRGERLREPAAGPGEAATPSRVPSLVALRTRVGGEELAPRIESLLEAARDRDDEQVATRLTELARFATPRLPSVKRSDRGDRGVLRERWKDLYGDGEASSAPDGRDARQASAATRAAMAMGKGED